MSDESEHVKPEEEPEGPRDARHILMLAVLALSPFVVAFVVWLVLAAS